MRSLALLFLLCLTACSTTPSAANNKNCPNEAVRPCPEGTNTGLCKKGTQTCSNGTWQKCKEMVDPAAEKCNGRDDDCNGLIDDNKVCGVYPSNSDKPCLFIKNLRKAICDEKQDCRCYITPDGNEWTCFGETKEKVRWVTLNELQQQCGREGLAGFCGIHSIGCTHIGRLRWAISKYGYLERMFRN